MTFEIEAQHRAAERADGIRSRTRPRQDGPSLQRATSANSLRTWTLIVPPLDSSVSARSVRRSSLKA